MSSWQQLTVTVLRGVAALGIAVILASCASVPSQEMSDARRAVDSAREAGAGRHLPLVMQQASRALDEAAAALRAGDYERARRLADNARDTAIAARTVGDSVESAERAIAAARAGGRPYEGARDLLDQAVDAARAGQTTRALDMAKRAAALAR